ncbi:MAG TPA: hypothetical protein VF735_21125 [Pyrinomonadaceae bacterium]|jgi:hypothetical protein
MRDDYLWDGSGEPDPETERLERTLQKLRHQPKPLQLPAVPARRQPFYGLAAAAAVVLLVLAAGTWVALLRRSHDTASERLLTARRTPGTLSSIYGAADSFALTIDEVTAKREANTLPEQLTRESRPRRVVEERQTVVAAARKRAPLRRRDERLMREGEMAKEQLMLALHYASSKLNLVQRKIQANKASGPAS